MDLQAKIAKAQGELIAAEQEEQHLRESMERLIREQVEAQVNGQTFKKEKELRAVAAELKATHAKADAARVHIQEQTKNFYDEDFAAVKAKEAELVTANIEDSKILIQGLRQAQAARQRISGRNVEASRNADQYNHRAGHDPYYPTTEPIGPRFASKLQARGANLLGPYYIQELDLDVVEKEMQTAIGRILQED